jgi:hypothetical protein
MRLIQVPLAHPTFPLMYLRRVCKLPCSFGKSDLNTTACDLQKTNELDLAQTARLGEKAVLYPRPAFAVASQVRRADAVEGGSHRASCEGKETAADCAPGELASDGRSGSCSGEPYGVNLLCQQVRRQANGFGAAVRPERPHGGSPFPAVRHKALGELRR